jgi:catechol 2,3-dioxygenase-like lactoylglutathione lyase family enzyme
VDDLARQQADRFTDVRIAVRSVYVDDQEKALSFYTDVLGFETNLPLGEARWLTVVSPDEPTGTELLLEPDGHPAVKPFKEQLVADGIPFASFAVDDVRGVRAASRPRRDVRAGAGRDG